jgi:DHA3 family tetracycline resistance protein-like MFS transporter
MQHSHEALDRPGGLASHGLLTPLRHLDFRILWAGMAVSLLGDGIFLVAVAWESYALWNAPAALSIVGIGMTVPTVLFLLVGGVVSDRCERRRVMLWSDAVRAATVGVLALLVASGSLQFWQLVALVAVYGSGTAFFTPAFEAVVPDLLPAEDLPAANSLDQLVRPVALRLAGPLLGGAAVAVGPAIAFAVDAASFVASLLAVLAIEPRALVREAAPPSAVGAVREAFGFIRRRAWLWATLASAAVAYLVFLGPTEVLLPYVVKNELHASASTLGLVFGAGGLGAVLGAVWMGRRGHPSREVSFMYGTWTVATLAVAGYGIATAAWQLMLACLVFNALEAAGTIVWATIKQRHVPSTMLGRVSSLDWLISIGLLPISFALTAPVAAALGVRATLVGAAVIGAVATVAPLFLRGIRDVEGSAHHSSGSGLGRADAAAVATSRG